MPRQKRKMRGTEIYHVMIRGINRQMIFEDAEDYCKFLKVLKITKEKSEFKVYGYCLMGNHLRLLIREGKESLAKAMQRLCSRFVYWYNYKYDRCGHLFQERFKSEVVATNEKAAKEEFKKNTCELNEDICLEYKEKHRVRDDELIKLIEEKYGVKKGSFLFFSFLLLESKDKVKLLKDLKKIDGTTIRQIVRVTGATKYRVERI